MRVCFIYIHIELLATGVHFGHTPYVSTCEYELLANANNHHRPSIELRSPLPKGVVMPLKLLSKL